MTEDQTATRLTIEIDEDGVTVFAAITADVEGIEYFEEDLEDHLFEAGCSGLSVISSAHEKIAELFETNHPGRVRLGQKIDAKVEVLVSGDALSASLRITAAKGGKQAATEDVMDELNDKEIELKLVNKNRVVGLLRKSRIIEPGETVEVVIAKGRAPEHGKDTEFECLLDEVTDRKPQERGDGTLDYYDLGEIVSVEEGCQLMRKHAPTPAKNGKSVTGQELPARIGKALNFKKCKGAVVSPIDSDLLISKIKGQPVIVDKGVTVDSVYTVNKVDLHTGHVDYDGSIVVRGDVASGMNIKVSGDVQIFGMVENASIEAGGNVDIKLGVIGQANGSKEENGLHINCKGNLTAGYLENIAVNVEGDVLIKSRISNCELNGGYQVIVGNQQQQKSGIVGGRVLAGSIIRAEVLGSSGHTLTHVAISCSADVLERFETLKKDIVEHNEILVRMLGLMVGLKKKRSEDAKQLLKNTKKETADLKAVINGLITQKDEIESSLEQVKLGKIIVKKEAFPGVTIKVFDQDQEIKSRYGQGTFLLYEGSISHNSSVK